MSLNLNLSLSRSYNMGERERDRGERERGESKSVSGRTLGMVIKEKDDELALFLEMRKREKEDKERDRDKEANFHHQPLEMRGSGVPMYNNNNNNKTIPNIPSIRKAGIDDFLNSDNDKNDYDWLLTPPGTPLIPSLEYMETKKSPVKRLGTPKSRQTTLKSRLANPHTQEPPPSSTRRPGSSAQPTSTLRRPGSSDPTSRRPGSSSGPPTSSRPATPTGRTATRSSTRPSTPTSRPVPPASKPAPVSKPVSRSTTPSRPARSSTPTRSSSLPTGHMGQTGRDPKPLLSRSSTPTRRTPTTTTTPQMGLTGRSMTSSSSTQSGRSTPVGTRPSQSHSQSSLMTKSAPVAATRGASPTVRSRPWKPSEMPGFSLDAPPNLRTSLPSDRPASASRGRPGAPSARSSSVDTGGPQPNPRLRRQSCSPSRGRAPNTSNLSHPTLTSSSSSLMSSRRSAENPVAIGNKMVERVVNMRRLAPPKRDGGESGGLGGGTGGTGQMGRVTSAGSPDGNGFGRNLSKKSLDMALRHMDIRRSIPNNLRPLMTNIPASSMYSVKSGGPTRSRQVSMSDSPLATSSNASSEPSVNNLICLEGNNETEEDFVGLRL
ncbi:hypothetical protein LUZ60_009168 [Juncus effusus]|nr:hypothetical protein LUZ60_009168 [Juncus effusus]